MIKIEDVNRTRYAEYILSGSVQPEQDRELKYCFHNVFINVEPKGHHGQPEVSHV